VKLRATLLALLCAVAVAAGSSQATITSANLTLTASPLYAFVKSSPLTLYYSAHSGSVTVDVNDTTDNGPLTVDFPDVFADNPGAGPSTSHTYNWTASDTDSGSKQVTLSDLDGTGTPHSFTVTRDITAPTGMSVALVGGPNYGSLSIPLTLGTGTDAGSGVNGASGVVERDSVALTSGTCGSFSDAWAPVTLSGGADTSVASGNCYRYRYTIADNVGNSATSAASATAVVNTVVPTVAVAAPTEGSGASDQFWSATTKTLWFRPAATGSFTLNATATPATGLTITQVAFPDVSATSGWSGSTGGADTSSPYASPASYTWAAGAAAPGGVKVKATSSDGLTATDTLTIGADSTAPTGQGVTVTGGPWFGGSVPLALVSGSDSGSGVDATRSVVERASATLANGVCGTFGTFAAVTLSGNADKSVTSGGCYRYQVKAADNVGNVSVASKPSEDAKVDTTAPTIPTLYFSGFSNTSASGKVVYFRPGGSGSFTVTAASSDPESGVTSYSFPTVSGFTVAGSGPRRTYAFSGSGSAPTGPLSVTATNAAGLSSSASSFTLVGDGTAPSLIVRCNGGACNKKPYAKAVTVTLAAADATSGVGTVRWTSDGSEPTADHGNEYQRSITVNGVTRLKVRAFDRAGNASSLVSVTVVSLASRLAFRAPAALKLGPHARFASLRVTSTRRASVRMTMTGTGLKRAARWSFILDPGTSIVRLRLPKGVKHPGTYRIVWTLTSGSGKTTKSTRLTLRR
jgi:chitobiase/beta-hexosaminidase-like protein